MIKISRGTEADIDGWMKPVRRMRGLFPGLETELRFMNAMEGTR